MLHLMNELVRRCMVEIELEYERNKFDTENELGYTPADMERIERLIRVLKEFLNE